MGSAPHDDPRITAFGLFVEAYTGLVARFSRQLTEHGLSLIEFEVLVRLARSPEHRLRMTQLAGQVAVTTSGITRVVDRLERAELVRREACPSDRRGAWAALTGAGLARLTTALPDHLALLERHFTGRFSAAELQMLTARLRAIRDDVHPAARPDHPAGAGRSGGANRNDPPAVRPEHPPAPIAAGSRTGRTGGRKRIRSSTVGDISD